MEPSWWKLAVLTLVLVLALSPAVRASQQISITDLGLLPGFDESIAWSINNRGQVVGMGFSPPGESRHASLWEDGTVTDLGVLPDGADSEAYGINNRRQVVGLTDSSMGPPFVWQDGTMTPLVALPGEDQFAEGGTAVSLNERGQIVGSFTWRVGGTRYSHAVLWQDSAITDLGVLPGYRFSEAFGVNNRGQIVGLCIPDGPAPWRAFFWQDGSMTELEPLPGDDTSVAHAINERGDAVGWSYDTASPASIHAVLWHDGTVTDLGFLPGDTISVAYGINNRGQVVGSSENPGVAYHAFLWEKGKMTQLPDLPGALGGSIANGINDRGQIAGSCGISPTGGNHAVVWRVDGGRER